MSSFKAKIAAVATFAAASGTALLVTAGAASAAPTVPASAITNDPNAANGTVSFYDASGAQVTSGSNLNHLFDYAYASSAATRSPSTKATLYFSFPDHTQADSQNWVEQQASAASTFPNTGATTPASVKGKPNPLVSLVTADANYNALSSGVTLDTTAGYAGIVQIRVYDSGPGVPRTAPFWASDVYVDTTAGTWTQVFPTFTSTSVSSPVANPASPAASGTTSVALSATVSASDATHPSGSVELFNGATDLGPATFDAATGAASATASVRDGGNYSFIFKFTPSGNYAGSSSSALSYRVKGAAQSTTTTLTGPASANVGDALTYTASVAQGTTALGAADGKVQFSVSTDGTTFNNVGSPVALDSAGHASFTYPTTAAGTVYVKGAFAPTDPTAYNASTSNTVTTAVAAAAYNPDPQNVTVTVPQGTLVISTPYTVANPFKLGTMQLNAAGTQYTASANFGDPAAPAAAGGATPAADPTTNGVTITDTRAGSTGWVASAQTTDFTNPGLATVIDGNNLSFTNVKPKYLTGNHLRAGSVTTNDITAFKAAKKSFANTTQGPGTVNITGVLNLTAPTSTLPGDYTATVTFTIA